MSNSESNSEVRTLCVFFALILILVSGGFVWMLINASERNRALSDQLIQYMRTDRQELVSGHGAQNDATVKALSESVAALQEQLAEQQLKFIWEQQSKLLQQQKQPPTVIAPVSAPSAAELRLQAAQKKLEEAQKVADEKLKRARAQLAAEKADLAKARADLHQQQVEFQRRKLYPEFYEEQDKAAAAVAEPTESADMPAPAADDDGIEELKKQLQNVKSDGAIQYFDEEEEVPGANDAAFDEAIRYFDDEDTEPEPTPAQKPTAPAPKRATSDWSIPLD